MDADALIKLTRASLKEAVVENLDVVLPPEVERETVHEGKAGDHPDALVIERNIQEGNLEVRAPPQTGALAMPLEELGVQGGEVEVLQLHASTGSELIVSDDARFLRTVEGLGLRFTTPAALVVILERLGVLDRKQALDKLDALAPHISEAEHVGAREVLLEEHDGQEVSDKGGAA